MVRSRPEALASIRSFDELLPFLRDELGWPIEIEDMDGLVFPYSAEELGIEEENWAKIEWIRRLRPLSVGQPWGIFFVQFARKRLPVVALRRILSRVTVKNRSAGHGADLPSWNAGDLLFISFFGDGENRSINFAHFTDGGAKALPTLKVVGWDRHDTGLHLDRVADDLTDRLRWPDDETDPEAWRKQWRAAFTVGHREVIRTADRLSARLAELAGAIRDRVEAALGIETEQGWVTKLMRAFKEALVHDLTPRVFADTYAQTVAYGLLSARLTGSAGAAEGDLTRHLRTNPLLRDLLEAFLGGERAVSGTRVNAALDFDELAVSEVVAALDAAKMDAVLRDFRRRQRDEDPVIHFYESFLERYDPENRRKRGVFYTPRPVVRYIVRSVDTLLCSEFGLSDGLADTATWAEVSRRRPGLAIPEEVSPATPFVSILDPAAGTGTFLVEVIDCIYERLRKRWKAEGCSERQIEERWNRYVRDHLLARLYGYELMMAPYAMAHLNISLKLRETGYRFDDDGRAHVYLTNTLEPPHDFTGLLETGIPALAQESEAVNDTKKNRRFTVVLGNPPYAGHSANKGMWIRELVSDYKRDCPELRRPGQAKWLSDDYVKFLRYGQYVIGMTGQGIMGVITNHSYLDNKTFRGMRRMLLDQFDSVFVLDLHGNVKKGTALTRVERDENVFDIQQGVAIGMFARAGVRPSEKKVLHAELLGKREEKARVLETETFGVRGIMVAARDPEYLLIPRNEALVDEYMGFWSLPSIFSVNGDPAPGIVTTHDKFAISWNEQDAIQKVQRFLSTRDEHEAREIWTLCSQNQWQYARAKRELASGEWRQKIVPILYRPFDVRATVYDRNVAVHRRERVMRHMLCNTHTHTTSPLSRQDNVSGTGESSPREFRSGITPFLRTISVRSSRCSCSSTPFGSRDTSGRGDRPSRHRDATRSSDALGSAVGDSVLGLITCRQLSGRGIEWCHSFVTRFVIEACAISSRTREINYLHPLWMVFEGETLSTEESVRPNLDPLFVDALAERVGLVFRAVGREDMTGTFGPEDVFHYIYAVLSSPTYRSRYGDFLRADFPRVPLPGGRSVFGRLTGIGRRLTELSLMETEATDGPRWRSAPEVTHANRRVGRVHFSQTGGRGRVWLNEESYCEEVPAEVWDFSIGGYRPAQKWLKDRKGRTLDDGDLDHYRAIVSAIGETIRRMAEVDEVIAAHGGWPGAFEPREATVGDEEPASRLRLVEPEPDDRYRTCVPFVPLRAAAGAFSETQVEDEYEDLPWVEVHTRHRLREGMFVARVVGKSMEPRIPDGACCLFRGPVAGTRQGMIVLAALRVARDPETDERWTVKRYDSTKRAEGDSWRHDRITLSPLNPDFEPIGIDSGDDLRIVAEFLEALGDLDE